MSDAQITHNSEKSRYEAHLDGETAGVAMYELGDGTITFTHTIVEPKFEGRGVGSALIRTALDEVRAAGERSVIAECSFVAGWIDKQPDYQDLLAQQ